jgi:hypothetical protein
MQEIVQCGEAGVGEEAIGHEARISRQPEIGNERHAMRCLNRRVRVVAFLLRVASPRPCVERSTNCSSAPI